MMTVAYSSKIIVKKKKKVNILSFANSTGAIRDLYI